MSGERNHKYFKDSILKVEEAVVEGTVYHIDEQRCPSIELGSGQCIGELITYQDPEGTITNSIIAMEQEFDGLDYSQVKTQAVVGDKLEEIKVFCYPLSKLEKQVTVNGRWSEQKYI